MRYLALSARTTLQKMRVHLRISRINRISLAHYFRHVSSPRPVIRCPAFLR